MGTSASTNSTNKSTEKLAPNGTAKKIGNEPTPGSSKETVAEDEGKARERKKPGLRRRRTRKSQNEKVTKDTASVEKMEKEDEDKKEGANPAPEESAEETTKDGEKQNDTAGAEETTKDGEKQDDTAAAGGAEETTKDGEKQDYTAVAEGAKETTKDGEKQDDAAAEEGAKETTKDGEKQDDTTAEEGAEETAKDGEKQDDEAAEAAAKKKKEPPTEEELIRRTAAILKKATNVCEFLTSTNIRDEEGEFSTECRKKLFTLNGIYFSLKDAPILPRRKMRVQIGEMLHSMGGVAQMCSIAIEILDKGCTSSEGKHMKHRGDVLRYSMMALTNFSNSSPGVATAMTDHPRYVDRIGQYLSENLQGHLEKALSDFDKSIMKNCLSHVHNMGMVAPNEVKLREKNFTQLLLPYLKSPAEIFRLTAITSLADIVDEKESELLQTSKDSISFLLQKLHKALNNKQRKDLGWSSIELARAIGRLARNDTNKKLLVDMGCLPLLTELVQSDDMIEVRQGLESIWMMSFHEDVKRQVMEEPGLLDMVTDRYTNCEDRQVKKLCAGILWTLRDLLHEDVRYKETVQKVVRAQVPDKPDPAQGPVSHVMISYQWANQPVTKRIAAELRNHGYKVWIDVDSMGGSTLQAMADAIENARVILMCMSQKYKDSPNCRAEAEYAFQQRKKIVPLIMERGYKPDGWLGMILGAKLYYEFSPKYTFESRIDGLLKELDAIYERDAKSSQPPDQNSRDKLDSSTPKNSSMNTVVLPGSTSQSPAGTPSSSVKTAAPTHSVHPTVPGPCHWTVQTPAVSREVTRARLATTGNDSSASMSVAAMVERWTPTDVEKWRSKHNLEGSKYDKMNGATVGFLIKLRAEAPEYFYRTVESRFQMTDLPEFASFLMALEDICDLP